MPRETDKQFNNYLLYPEANRQLQLVIISKEDRKKDKIVQWQRSMNFLTRALYKLRWASTSRSLGYINVTPYFLEYAVQMLALKGSDTTWLRHIKGGQAQA